MDPLIQEGAQRQSQLEVAKAAFLLSGGMIKPCIQGETKPLGPSMWNTAITRRKDARREFERLEATYADIIRDYAALSTDLGVIRRTPIQVRNKLRELGIKLTTPQVEQIAAKYRVLLSEIGKQR